MRAFSALATSAVLAIAFGASCFRVGLNPWWPEQDARVVAADGDSDADADGEADGPIGRADADADAVSDGDGAHADVDAESDGGIVDVGSDAEADAWDPAWDDALSVYFAVGDGLSDATGDGATGTCTSCPVEVATAYGPAWEFDGTDAVDIADDGRIHWPAGFTVAINVLPRSLAEFTCIVMKIFGTGYLNTFKVGTRPDLDFETTEAGGVDRLQSGVTLTPDVWVHLAVTWDGTNKRLYVDGVEVASETAPAIDNDANPIVAGADRDSGSNKEWLDGLLRDLRLYDRALSGAEVATLVP